MKKTTNPKPKTKETKELNRYAQYCKQAYEHFLKKYVVITTNKETIICNNDEEHFTPNVPYTVDVVRCDFKAEPDVCIHEYINLLKKLKIKLLDYPNIKSTIREQIITMFYNNIGEILINEDPTLIIDFDVGFLIEDLSHTQCILEEYHT